MATTAPKPAKKLPQEILDAIDHGVVTQAQLKEIIEFRAEALGLGYDEAVQRARKDTLPRNTTGTDLRLLVSLLIV